MDKFADCDLIRPEMGSAQCFLGAPWGDQWEARKFSWHGFFLTPEFIYFHGILLALQVTNIIFFLMTNRYLMDHWNNTAQIVRNEPQGNFLIVVKLFFIMGGNSYCYFLFFSSIFILGVPWMLEFISQLMTYTSGPGHFFYYRIVLDLTNLFTVSLTVNYLAIITPSLKLSFCFSLALAGYGNILTTQQKKVAKNG